MGDRGRRCGEGTHTEEEEEGPKGRRFRLASCGFLSVSSIFWGGLPVWESTAERDLVYSVLILIAIFIVLSIQYFYSIFTTVKSIRCRSHCYYSIFLLYIDHRLITPPVKI